MELFLKTLSGVFQDKKIAAAKRILAAAKFSVLRLFTEECFRASLQVYP